MLLTECDAFRRFEHLTGSTIMKKQLVVHKMSIITVKQ